MRALLIALALCSLGADTLASGAVWQGRHVVVRDYSTADWRPLVQQAVVAFNRVMPRRGPHLVYRGQPERGCGNVSRARGIAVCAGSVLMPQAGLTGIGERGHTLRRVRIALGPYLSNRANTLCHEFMHALADAPDRDAGRGDSCVWGELDHPGPFDRHLLKRAYRRHR